MFKLPNLILIITTTTTALMAGLFYSWTVSVTGGLSRLPDSEYISAMQSINRAIQNFAFFVCFLGTVLLLPACTYFNYSSLSSSRFWCLFGATVIYITGVFGVTIFGNVPLNEALDTFNLHSASLEEMAIQRNKFEIPWNNLNRIRTVASFISMLLLIVTCTLKEEV